MSDRNRKARRMITSVDAHKNKIALARWHAAEKRLCSVSFVQGSQTLLRDYVRERSYQRLAGSSVVVVEKMQIYPNERVKDPNDLLEVSKVVGMCHFLGETVVEYFPREWKGQLPKKTHHDRIKKVLTQIEMSVLGKYIKNEHVLDAVGLGLFYLRRT